MTNNAAEQGKTLAIVSYITIIGTLIAFFMNREDRNPFVSFHVRQALGLGLTWYILGYFIGGFDSWMITLSFWIFFMVLFLYGIFGAATGKMNEVPLIGAFFQKIFSAIGQ
ncbi:MAG: DUF4870 domain-containing protein [Algicola sp.]|nr:DUF4870 domain-containing protein [Algicola sp.]